MAATSSGAGRPLPGEASFPVDPLRCQALPCAQVRNVFQLRCQPLRNRVYSPDRVFSAFGIA